MAFLPASAGTLLDHLPALQVIVPLIGAALCAVVQRGTLAWLISLVVSWLVLAIAGGLLAMVLSGGTISYAIGGWEPPYGIEYRVDVLNAFVLLLVSFIAAVIIPFARKSVASEIDSDKQAWFYTMYLLCLGGLLGIAITGDAFNVFVFLEISSLATYVMIAMGRDKRALLAAYQYLIIGTIGATFYVLGIGFLYTLTGSLNLVDIAARLQPIGMTPAVLTSLACITVGISLKLALFPLHVWLPNAYAYAPSFATAFLAATATKVAVYLLLRFYFSVFGLGIDTSNVPVFEILLVLSIAAMFGASIVAIFQENLKRMLAYSSVAQIGYMTLGISLANKAGLTGGIVHLFNHAITKAALFLTLGAVVYRMGTVRISELDGIGRRMPITMATFVLAGLSIIGVPGTAGFVSKWNLAVGAMEKGWWWLVLLIMASSVLAVIYIGRVVEVAWFREPTRDVDSARVPPASMYLPMLLLGAATIYFGLDTSLTSDLAAKAAAMLLGMGGAS